MFAPSIIYAPNDPYVTLLERMSLLPVMPIPGDGTARFAPIWSEDVADCVVATLPGGTAESDALGARYELAGPDVLTHRQIVKLVLAATHRRRRIIAVSPRLTRPVLKAVERISGPDDDQYGGYPAGTHQLPDAGSGVVDHRVAELLEGERQRVEHVDLEQRAREMLLHR